MLPLGDRKAVHVRTQTAREQRVSVDDEMMRRDRGADARPG